MGTTRRIAVAALVALLLLAATPRPDRAAGGAPAGLHVAGNRLVDGLGRTVVLHGVDRSGTEYMCVQGQGIFDGPSDDRSVRAIAAWHVNVVRLPLNESCWLGIGGVPVAYAGAAYQRVITAYVALLNAHGMAAILDLAVVNPGRRLLNGQQPLPDRDNSPAFWRSVATAFKANSVVLFDLYNEPHDVSWHCWRFGGCHPLARDKADQPVTYYQAAGMQELVTAVRGTRHGGGQRADARRHPLRKRHPGVAGLRAIRSAPQSNRLLARLSQRLPLSRLLERPDSATGGTGPGHRRRDGLRPSLHRYADELAGRAPHRLSGLGLGHPRLPPVPIADP